MILELKQVEKRVGKDIHIHPTDLRLEPGHFNFLLGTTLAGKTTLMQLMAGLEAPTAGEVWFNGQDVTGVPVRKRNVSMVYQQFINYPNMTVFENIASPLKVAGIDAQTIRNRVGSMAEVMKISALLGRLPSELSGGQQQRTAMARALVKDSDMVLLDEPLANLDFKLREELRDELPGMFAERDCILVYATTEPAEALLLGGYAAALHQGAVADFGRTGQIYRHPANLTGARVFSEPPINVAMVTNSGGKIVMNDRVYWAAPAGLPEGEYTIGIRPHHVHPVKTENDWVEIDATIMVAELSGSESIIHFDAFGNSWISLSHGVHPFDAGQKATMYADMSRCLYFDEAERLVETANLEGSR